MTKKAEARIPEVAAPLPFESMQAVEAALAVAQTRREAVGRAIGQLESRLVLLSDNDAFAEAALQRTRLLGVLDALKLQLRYLERCRWFLQGAEYPAFVPTTPRPKSGVQRGGKPGARTPRPAPRARP